MRSNRKYTKQFTKVFYIVPHNIWLESNVKQLQFLAFCSQNGFDVPPEPIVIPPKFFLFLCQ